MKRKAKSFRFKLWMYFILFTALIFTVLWLLQTVFLQSFYNAMIIRNTKDTAEQIRTCVDCIGYEEQIDNLTHDNTLLVFITDTGGRVLYSSDAFKGLQNQMHLKDKKSENSGNSENTGKPGNIDDFEKRDKKEMRGGIYRNLPEVYEDFLDTILDSETGTAEYTDDSLYIYGTVIDADSEIDRRVLYVSSTIDGVGSSVSIIRIQLMWVTLLSLLAGFVLAWFLSRRFANPVGQLTEKAGKLGEQTYSDTFRKGFCSELDELSDTLDKTHEKLMQARDFQMELLANVSHDLRTPITMIKGYAEMVRDISWEDEQQCREDLAVVIKEADRLTALVNEIMEYSEMQTEGLRSDLVPLNLSRLVQKTADSFETLYKPVGIHIERSIEPDVYVSGNSGRLQRALYNLLDNAYRHTDDSKRIDFSLSIQDTMAKIAVRDYGAGIPQTDLPHIWDRYYTARQRKGKGVSGLGLAIVRQITQMHNGTCCVESSDETGSTFVIMIPRQDDNARRSDNEILHQM